MKYQGIDFIKAVEKYGSQREASRQLNIPWTSFKRYYKNQIKKNELTEKLDDKIPNGQKLRGVSTLYNADGEATMQWVKTNADLERQHEMLFETAKALAEELPKEKPVTYTGVSNKDLCACYVISDYHLGMLSWPDETGEDWNLDIAEDMLVKWFMSAIASASDAHTAVLCNLGDFLHWDGLDAVTPTSGHILDADSRFPKIVSAAIRVLRRVINLLLEAHEHVHIVMAEGNHDLSASVWLRALFSEKYADESRVTVDGSHNPYYAYEWGETSLFFHHGHKKRINGISEVFAAMYRDMFGRTKYSYAHVGHLHHKEQKENGLMIIEQHQTLAAKDSHSVRGGYNSQRSASVITYHKKHGEVARQTFRPEMVM
jgi:hypothetical protein